MDDLLYQDLSRLSLRLTPSWVAADLGISEGTVYVAKSRVMLRLRQELAGLTD